VRRLVPLVAAALALAACGDDRSSPERPAAPARATTAAAAAKRPPAPRPPVLCRGPLRATVTGAVAAPEATELSGLALSRRQDGVLWTHNDSGDRLGLGVIALAGPLLADLDVPGAEAVDWEDIAVADDKVYVGDIGGGKTDRSTIDVLVFDEPETLVDGSVTWSKVTLTYPDGAHNAEALLVHPRTGRLYVVTKGLLGGEVMAAPATLRADRPNVLRPVARVGGLVTDGAFLPDGRHAVLRSYGVATLYDVPGWHAVASLRLPAQPQGEGLAVTGSGRRLLLSSEGAHTAVLSVPLSPRMVAALDPAARSAEPSRKPSEGQSPEPAGRSRVALVAGLAALVLSAGLGAVVLGRRAVRGARPRSRSTR